MGHNILRDYLSSDAVITVSQLILNAKAIELDGVAKDGSILNYAMSEHMENACQGDCTTATQLSLLT
ncbi:hypothetical protein PInf_022140 [Phytophthora infestans]|nr:hypothetical protein PInf_022140 [Phytophthora infestans]